MADFAVTENGATTYYGADGQPYPVAPAGPGYNQPVIVPNDPTAPTPSATTAAPTSGPSPTANITPAPAYTLPANTPTLTSDQSSAKAIITDTLDQYGLGSLATNAWNMYLAGESTDQVMLEIRGTPEYKQRFPGMAALAASGHAITETDYINLENKYTAVLRQAGMPAGFYDTPDDFATFIGKQVSPDELTSRLNDATALTYTLPPEVRANLGRLYGMSIGDITAHFLDPDVAQPLLHQQFLSAGAAAGAQLSGYGNLTASEAQQVALSGADFGQSLQGFGQLAGESQLFTPLAGNQGESAISEQDQLAAQFGGNANAQRRIQQRAAQRVAVFNEGGGATHGGFGKATT